MCYFMPNFVYNTVKILDYVVTGFTYTTRDYAYFTVDVYFTANVYWTANAYFTVDTYFTANAYCNYSLIVDC